MHWGQYTIVWCTTAVLKVLIRKYNWSCDQPFVVIILFQSKYSPMFEHGGLVHGFQCVYIVTWSYNRDFKNLFIIPKPYPKRLHEAPKEKSQLQVTYRERESVNRGVNLPPFCCWRLRTATSICDLRYGHTCDYEWQLERYKLGRGDAFFLPSISLRQKHTFGPSGDKRDCYFLIETTRKE